MLKNNIDIQTLELQPLPVILFDNKQIYFLNKKAIDIFCIPKKELKELNKLSMFNYIDKSFHKLFFINGKLNFNTLKFKTTEINCLNHKNERIFIKAKFNSVIFNHKKVIQIFLSEVNQEVKKPLNNIKELKQKSDNYKTILDSSPIGIFIHKGFCLYANKTAADILEIKQPQTLIGKYLVDYIIPEQREQSINRMERAIMGEKLSDFIYTIKTAKGNLIEVELKTTPIIYDGKKVAQTIILNSSDEKALTRKKIRAELMEETNKNLKKEIERRKKIQDALINQTTKFEAIFNNTSHLIWTINKDYNITSFNENFSKEFEQNNGVKPKLNSPLFKLLPKPTQNIYKLFWHNYYKKVFKGEAIKLEKDQTDPRGKTRYFEIFLNPVISSNNEVIEIACLAHDITEHKLFEKKIIDQSAKLKAIFESGNQLMWTIDKELKLTSFNKNYANSIFDFYGYYPEIGKSIRSNKTTEYHSLWDDKYELAFRGNPVEFISERTQKNGSKIIRQILLHPIKDINNQVIEVSGIGFDITENKRNEEKISQSLKEKDILLKEVHHRVKNNMQVISSILNLQSSYVKDSYALTLLKECQNRIKSMAFIHESLYQTKNFESVNFSEYVTTLSKNLIHTYSINTHKIKLILRLDKLFLSLDVSIPCGLIINEIISNSLKYAFPDNRDGIIFVNLSSVKNKVIIEVGDNGVGIRETVDVKNTQTLGLQLVDTLVEQINGTVKLTRNKGTIFNIEFSI